VLIVLLKWLSQVIILVVGAMGVRRAHSSLHSGGKRKLTRHGKLALSSIFLAFLLFATTDLNERQGNSQRNSIQQNTITELQKVNDRLVKMSRNRDFAGVEISYTPSAEEWARIEAAFNKIQSPVPGIPYSAATMKAERTADKSGDNWKIDFDFVSRPEGVIRFPPVATTDPRAKAFSDVIREASLPIWIKWGSNVVTELEPRREQYASAISISQKKIAFTLRSPELKLNLNDVNPDLTILVRANSKPSVLRFLSLDDDVSLDQNLDMKWVEDNVATGGDDDYIRRTKPYVSGPHKLQITLKI
jgi:hypothetical protein